MSAIYLRHGNELVEMVEQPYEAEEVLQRLLADYPSFLGGDEEREERKRWLLVTRELGVGAEEGAGDRWSLDHLFLDEEGVPTLVEVKRSTDTRIRREVVGQMLDYAANASVSWRVEKIRVSFETRRENEGEDPADSLAEFLGEDADPDQFWERVGTNLKAGRLRLVFVADRIPPELRRVVEFLNEQMTGTEVIALEVKQYLEKDGTRQILVPRLIGQTEAARQVKGAGSTRTRRTWGEQDLIAAISKAQPPEFADRMIRLYDLMRNAGARCSWGTGGRPSVTMWLGEDVDEERAYPVSVTIHTESVVINFDFVREMRSPEEMERLARLMREVPGVADYIQGVDERNYGMHRAMRPADVLASEEALDAWKNALVEAARPA
jgi:hypothetical protein